MLIAVVPVKNYTTAKPLLTLAQTHADGVELRLDYQEKLALDEIAVLRREFSLPMIFTLRTQSQGGNYQADRTQRLADLLALCQLNPEFLDLEHDTPESILQTIKKSYPQIKIIRSYHNFTETPADLPALLKSLLNPYCDAYKIAAQANSTTDALRMLEFTRQVSKKYLFTGICMGADGQSTRILSAIAGNAFHYASIDPEQATAPGQLSLQELLKTYHFRQLNRDSTIYALLGDPVQLSVGHILHNQALRMLQHNAVYIKLRTTPAELPQVLAYCRRLPFAGFSVTMPLKEIILPLLDQIAVTAQLIRAINTIQVQQPHYIGWNTDGSGATQALAARLPLAKQKIVILGAGGSARAIAYEARRQQAEVIILNRTFAKAEKLAQELGCSAYALNSTTQLKQIQYTTLVNTLPGNVYAEPDFQAIFQPDNLLPNQIAMDIVYQPVNTPFLQIARQANNVCIPGFEMYINQALLQIQHWFNPAESTLQKIKQHMQNYFSMSNLALSPG